MSRTDPEVWESTMRSQAVEAITQAVLTETQYRRVALLYGFDGQAPRTVRQVARMEQVYPNAVQQSHDAALTRLRQNGHLLLLWLTLWI